MNPVGLFLTGSAVFLAPQAFASGPQDAATSQVQNVSVDIPGQSLPGALNAFSTQTGLVLIVLTPEGRLATKSAPPLVASGPPGDLLAALLAGSGVAFEFSASGAIVLTEALQAAPESGFSTDLPLYLDRVRVSGSYFESLAVAAAREQKAESASETVDAKGIADFPAQNAAEAILRITGVTVSRDRGEALFVGVRGLPANFQSVALNGAALAVNENVRDSSQNGRQFRFDVLPTDFIAGIDVIKAPTAAMDEGAIGAAINIRTFRPLSLPSGTLVLNAATSFPELAGGQDARMSVAASARLAQDRLGVFAALSANERTVRQDRITFGSWDEIPLPGTGEPEATVLAPVSLRPTLEREDRERAGFNGIVQFEPSASLSLEAEVFYVRLKADYRELTYSADLDPAALDPGSFLFRSGAVAGLTGQAASQVGYEVSELVHDNLLLSGGLRFAAEPLEITARLSYAEAGSQTARPITRTRVSSQNVGKVSFFIPELFDGLPDIRFLEADLETPGLLAFRRIEYRRQESFDTDQAAQVDLRHALNAGPWTSLSAGVKLRQRTRDYGRRDLIFVQGAGQFFPGSFYVPFPVDDFLTGAGGNLPRRWLQPNPEAFAEAAGFAPGFGAPSASDLRNSYEITETIGSAYLMSGFETEARFVDISGNLGVRLSQTNQVSAGHAQSGSDPVPVSLTTRYFDTLPSANLQAVFNERFDIRASAAKVIVRPSLADLAPRLTLNSSGRIFEAVGGNPGLKRFEAVQADLAARFQPSANTTLKAGLFYKDFGSFVYNQETQLEIGGRSYALTAPANGGDAKVYGVELGLTHRLTGLPGGFDGLGLEAGYTGAWSQATFSPTVTQSIENVAGASYRVSGIYERGRLQARVVLNAVGAIPQTVSANTGPRTETEAFRTLDAVLNWRLGDTLEISLEGQNLTDEAQYLSVSDQLFAGYTRYGRTLSLAVRYRTGP